MKKVLVLAALAALVMAGCSKKDATSAGAKPGKKVAVVFAGTENAATGQSRAMQEMADVLNASGFFDAQVQVAGALSNDTDNLVKQAIDGVPLVIPSDPGRLASQFGIPDLNILMAPYVLTDYSVLEKIPSIPLYQEWESKLQAQGISFVADMYNGYRNFVTVHKVEKVADLKGMRIRGFGNDIGVALGKYFNFAQTSMSPNDVYSAGAAKSLDGTEIHWSSAMGYALYEVFPYVAITKHYVLQSSFVCGTKLLNSMTAEQKALFVKTIRDTAAKWSVQIASEEEGLMNDYKSRVAGKGAVIDVDIAEFKNAVAPLYTNNDLKFSDGLRDKLLQQLGL